MLGVDGLLTLFLERTLGNVLGSLFTGAIADFVWNNWDAIFKHNQYDANGLFGPNHYANKYGGNFYGTI